MSALADALVAAQRRALAACEKQYAAGRIDATEFHSQVESIGLTDTVDADRLVAALDLIREYGATLPAEPAANGKPEDAPATDAQLALVAKLVKERAVPGPDLPLTKVQAHEIIDGLKAGTYDPGQWRPPF
jgi:hypothetical protein